MSQRNTMVIPLLLAVSLLLGFPSRLWPQTALSEVTGEITDATGSSMPSVTVTLTNTTTGIKTILKSNEAGVFYIRSLAPGVYNLEAELPAFKTYRVSGLQLSTGQVLRHDFKLEVGEVTQTVEVKEDAGALEIQKDSGDISSVITQQVVKEIPATSRKALQLVALTPATTLTGLGGARQGNLAFFSIAGNPGQRGNIYVLDGTNTSFPRANGDGGNLAAINPSTEVLKEMRVITNNYSAEFGQGVGGVLLMTTKSGTNDLHGGLYYFGQNDALDAKNYFASTKPPNHYHGFGGTVGGPIVKNKTHYYINIEQERAFSSAIFVQTLPTLEQRRGDFSRTFNAAGQLIPIYDPATTRTDPATGNVIRDRFPGNIIPADRLDPVAMNVFKYVPDPNLPGTIAGGNNFTARAKRPNLIQTSQFYRLDHKLTENDSLYARFTEQPMDQPVYGPWLETKGRVADSNEASLFDQLQRTVGGGWTHILSPTTLSDFRWGYTAFKYTRTGVGQPDVWQKDFAGQLGLKNLGPDTFPSFQMAGYQAIGGGYLGFSQSLTYETMRAWSFSETISQQRGKHNLRMGGEYKHSKAVYASRFWPSGVSNYDTRATALPGDSRTGNSVASFLLGQVASARVQDSPPVDARTWFASGFFQDDWRVSKRLTINLGLRYEYDKPKVNVTENTNFFNPTKTNPVSNTPGVVEFGVNKYAITFKHTPWVNEQPYDFAPRFGFAWTPTDKQDLVVRGGYGMFYVGLEYGDLFWDGPLLGSGINASYTSDGQGLTPAFKLSAGFPNPVLEPLNDSWGAVPVGQLPRVDVRYFYPDRPGGYAQQFNLSIQKEIGRNLLEVGYLGNASKKIPKHQNRNEVLPKDRGPGNAQIRRPFPQFGNVYAFGYPEGTSLYHAFLITFKRDFSNGLTFQTNYTFARHLDNISYTRSNYERMLDYGPSTLERRHRFVWAGVYELPWGPGRKFLNQGMLSNILGGWDLASFINLQSGQPVSLFSTINTCNCFTDAIGSAGAAGGTQGVDRIADHNKSTSNFDPRKDTWFNTAAFAFPRPFTYGNAGAGIITSPILRTVDVTLSKSFNVTERWRFEIRGEAFNLFNFVSFTPPNATLGSAAFGTITSALPARTVQYALRLSF